MQVPNKLYTYKKSTLAQIPIVLDAIKNGPVPVVDLYKQIRPLLDDATDFMSVMDCLYALGATSIGKSSALLAIDFVFGGDTYVKSDGVKQEGNHSIFFAFEFNGIRYYFERNTGDSDTFYICDNH